MIGACPLTGHYEVLMFLAWASALIYLLVGAPYRLSTLGASTAPFVVCVLLVGVLFYVPPEPVDKPGSSLREAHAAISMLAYGAFAISGLAGLLFLVQDRQLKSQRPRRWLFRLPPINDLRAVVTRLLILGLILLTIGLALGFATGIQTAWPKLAAGVVVWTLYALLLAAKLWTRLGSRHLAFLSVLCFVFALASLSTVHYFAASVP